MKILIVENDDGLRKAELLFLERKGHQISEASDEAAARVLFAAVRDIGCVLMCGSLENPKFRCNTVHLVQWMKSLRPEVKIFARSGLEESVTALLRAGCDRGFVKGVSNPQEIAEAIEALNP